MLPAAAQQDDPSRVLQQIWGKPLTLQQQQQQQGRETARACSSTAVAPQCQALAACQVHHAMPVQLQLLVVLASNSSKHKHRAMQVFHRSLQHRLADVPWTLLLLQQWQLRPRQRARLPPQLQQQVPLAAVLQTSSQTQAGTSLIRLYVWRRAMQQQHQARPAAP